MPHPSASPGTDSAQALDGSGAITDLNAWPMHTVAVVESFAGAEDAEAVKTLRRLADIGFLPGEPVQVVARGWLRGGPVAVRVGQSTFALRAHEASMLRVRAPRDSLERP